MVSYGNVRESLDLILRATTDPVEVLRSLDDAIDNNLAEDPSVTCWTSEVDSLPVVQIDGGDHYRILVNDGELAEVLDGGETIRIAPHLTDGRT